MDISRTGANTWAGRHHTMTNTTPTPASDPAPSAEDGTRAPSSWHTALWVVVVLSVLSNLLASFGDDIRVNLACGLVTLTAATLLALRYWRARR